MSKNAFIFPLLATLPVFLLPAAPAQAQNGTLTRSFVSSAGLDTDACTIAAPCATFAHAYTKISANGIIAALDPGKYGPIAITGPVTVNGNGWAAITAPAQGNGITITAGTGNVTLTGLEIDGAGAGYNGIVFNSGGNLVVKNCVLKDFVVNNNEDGTTGDGILIAPAPATFTFTIVDTIVSNIGWAGINYQPPSGSATATGVIDHVVVTGSSEEGISVSLALASGGSADISISNSVISNNETGVYGYAPQGSIAMTLDNDEISHSNFGIYNEGGATMVLGRSTIANNLDNGVVNYGTVDSFQNNQIYANGSGNAVAGNSLTNVSQQ